MTEEQLRPDIKQASDRMQSQIGAKREIRKLVEHLWEGEQVQHMVSGTYGPGNGLLVLTDRRLLFIVDGITRKASESFPLANVSSVQWKSAMITGTLTVFAMGNKAEIKNVGKAGGKLIAETIQNRQAWAPHPRQAASSPAPAPAESATAPPGRPGMSPAASQEDVFEALAKLGKLRDAGIVTPEEFEAKKKELLDRI